MATETSAIVAEMINQAKPVGDVLSLGVVVTTIVGLLPALAALVSIVWGCIRIYETDTVQKLLKKDKKE